MRQSKGRKTKRIGNKPSEKKGCHTEVSGQGYDISISLDDKKICKQVYFQQLSYILEQRFSTGGYF